MPLSLSPQVFAIVSQLIEEKTGLHYELRDAEALADKLSIRATELELDSLLDYYYHLRYDEAGGRELDALVELLVVNETYFFREVDQLRAFVSQLVPETLERKNPAPDKPIRIWCAACATGEEPLSLAMLLREHGLLERTEIVATDISARVLARARAGVYRGRAFRALGEPERWRHFEEIGDGALRVHADLVQRIRWQKLNLLDFAAIDALGRFDAILCRNVLIYFRDQTVLQLVERFAASLAPAGLLLVGASESLLRFGTVFDCEEHGGAFFYRKRTD